MKTLKQFFVLIVIALVAFALFACKEDDPPPTCKCPNGTVHTDAPCSCDGKDCNCTYEEQPVAITADLKLGDINITLKYKKKVSDPVPAYVARIQNRLTALAASANYEDPNNPRTILMNNLSNRHGNYTINVVYGGTSFDGFRATDGQTLEAHDSWLTANAENTVISTSILEQALQAMLAIPLQ